MNWSYWEKSSFIRDPDVLIIGSGIVGLNAAMVLKQREPHLHIVILERGALPYGASTRNAGFACFGSPSELIEDLKNSSEDSVFELVEKRYKGLQKLRHNLGDQSMQYEHLGGYEVFTNEQDELFQKCSDQLSYFNRHLKSITNQAQTYTLRDEKIKSFGFKKVSHLIYNNAEGQIDTGRMMKALLEKVKSLGVEVLNGITVEDIQEDDNSVTVSVQSYGKISGRKLLLATNGFSKKFLPEYDIQAARSQVLITKPIPGLKIKGCFHYDSGYYYLRNVGERILFGGGRNLDFKKEYTEEFGLTDLIQNALVEMLHSTFLPDLNFEIEMRWSGIMGLGSVKSTIVRQVSPRLFCCVRMGGMGIALGSLVAEEAAEMMITSG